MDSRPLVLDVSSDEEGWGETRGGGVDDDYDWISELLDEVETEEDESDDVVVVGEFMLNPKQTWKFSSVAAKPSAKDLDDDCVVLDGDPDKLDLMENNAAGDSDDLLIVGEKGQIACRDYPHPRHLCATFPFTSTPHERHCHQCHCYVCDSLAPCVDWGNGTYSNDHCHATDKDELWKLQRRNFKQGDKAPLPVSKLPDNSPSMRPPQTNQFPALVLQQPNSLAQNQILRPTTIRACSTSTNFGVPNIPNHVRSQQPVHVLSRNKFHPQLVSQHLLSARNNIVQRDRRHDFGKFGSQVINSRTIFKRAGSVGAALATNRSGYGSFNNNFATQYSRNPSHVVTSNDKNSTGWQGISSRSMSHSSAYRTPSQQDTGSSFGNSLPCQPRVSFHLNTGNVFVNSVPSQPQVSSQPNLGSSFVNPVPSLQASFHPNMGCNFENSVPSQPQVSLEPNMGSSFLNSEPLQNQVYSHPIPAANNRQDGTQLGNETQSALDPSFSDFNPSWGADPGQNNQQSFATNSQIESEGPTYHPPLVPEFDPQIPLNTIPGALDFEIHNWMLENQSVLGALDVSEPSRLNAYPPEPAPVDPCFFFDF
ncbi:hypothetical protein U1Q18_020420 [Sarracenia purpurea var. burkii]